MIGKLEFKLPEESAEFTTAKDAYKWKLVVCNVDQQLGNWIKYGNAFKDIKDTLQATRSFLHDEIAEYNLTLEAE